MLTCLAIVSIVAHAAREAPDPRAIKSPQLSNVLRPEGLLATRQCLEKLVQASGRDDVDVLRNGDLLFTTREGLRIEKATGRGVVVDAGANCRPPDLRGRLSDPDHFATFVRRAFTQAADREGMGVCARADQPILRDLVRPANTPPEVPPPRIGR